MSTLKLLARDGDDIQMVSAMLQDAIALACEMDYFPDKKSFVIGLQRFMWEERDMDPEAPFKRVNCSIEVTGVEHVQLNAVNPRDPAALFDLLTLSLKDEFLHFVFAGEGEIRLTLAEWQLRLRDEGEPWAVKFVPSHKD